MASLAGTLELKSEKTNAHGDEISSVAYNYDGTRIVSSCFGGTIKVWDSGAFRASNRPSLAKSDHLWLPWQRRWS